MTFRLATAPRNAGCNGIVDLLDGAGSTIKVYQVAQTATPNDADPAGGTDLLATLTFATPAFGASGAVLPGEAVAGTIASGTAVASGTAISFRIKTPAPAVHSDGTCGSGSGDLNFSTTNVIVSGGTVSCTSFKITVPQ